MLHSVATPKPTTCLAVVGVIFRSPHIVSMKTPLGGTFSYGHLSGQDIVQPDRVALRAMRSPLSLAHIGLPLNHGRRVCRAPGAITSRQTYS
jgi:hypothetical protein